MYDGFIGSIGNEVGELQVAPGETIRTLKVNLRRAATRTGIAIVTWEADGNVYFSREPRRGRPRKAKSSDE
jgi:hypothetical protein